MEIHRISKSRAGRAGAEERMIASVDACAEGLADGDAVSPETVEIARKLAGIVARWNLPILPEIEPTAFGGVEFDWFPEAGGRVTVCVHPNGDLSYVGRDRTGKRFIPVGSRPWTEGLPDAVRDGLRNLLD